VFAESDNEFGDESSDDDLPSPWEILGSHPPHVVDLTVDDEPGDDEVSNLPQPDQK
jgi:hypothetical protein